MDVSQLPSTTDATADDAVLARLDFVNDALILNLGAISHFGNPFLADVITTTLLAVAVAESKRHRGSRKASQSSFDPPPPSLGLGKKDPSTAQAFKESFTEGFQSFGGPLSKSKPAPPSGLRRFYSKSADTSKSSSSFDKDIELGDWYGQPKKQSAKERKKEKRKQKEEERSDLPFATRTIVGVLSFTFRACVFVLKIAVKVVAGVVVMITKNFSKL
jgi:hypothetical protein